MPAEMMDTVWKGAIGILTTVAPAFATAVGGPLAGLATRGMIEALGMPSGSTPQEVVRRIQTASTDELAALKVHDQQFLKDMKELDITLETLADADRANARARDPGDWMTKALALMTVITTTGIMIGLLTEHLVVKGEFIAGLLGVVVGSYKDVFGFFFGSSQGSRIKDYKINL